MDEKKLYKELFSDFFGDKFDLISYAKQDSGGFEIRFNCNIRTENGMVEFVGYYMSETNETIKQKFKSKDKKKSIYLLKAICRCYHDTRYEETR